MGEQVRGVLPYPSYGHFIRCLLAGSILVHGHGCHDPIACIDPVVGHESGNLLGTTLSRSQSSAPWSASACAWPPCTTASDSPAQATWRSPAWPAFRDGDTTRTDERTRVSGLGFEELGERLVIGEENRQAAASSRSRDAKPRRGEPVREPRGRLVGIVGRKRIEILLEVQTLVLVRAHREKVARDRAQPLPSSFPKSREQAQAKYQAHVASRAQRQPQRRA